MSGAMRKIGEYLGLLEDTGRYDDELDEDLYEPAAVGQSAPVARQGRPAPVADLAERRRPSAVAAPAGGTVAELSRITTIHPRTYNEARTVG